MDDGMKVMPIGDLFSLEWCLKWHEDDGDGGLFWPSLYAYALQEGKLCSASNVESLVYMLYFSCGGVFLDLDSVDRALQWRETSWSRR
ncbi:hypothetical protein Fmac_008730 [Flemingia macrophylla]|uniref:Uncharacterized protein n=1 Tax=Flemingia macrophylla TaxID=520843 RepID=A0ABD1N0M6_9FABA